MHDDKENWDRTNSRCMSETLVGQHVSDFEDKLGRHYDRSGDADAAWTAGESGGKIPM